MAVMILTHFSIQLLCQEVFFFFNQYDNLYLLTNTPYSNIYLFFDVGIFFAKVWYC